MARVEVFFYGALKDLTGEKSTGIEASTIKDLINALITVYGKPLENRIYAEDRRLRRFVNFFINGRYPFHQRGRYRVE